MDKELTGLVEQFAALPQVEAIALAGSHTTNMNDALSDYDLYVYTTSEIDHHTKKAIFDQYCSYMETNQFWELEDDGYLKNGTELEIIYRDINWLKGELKRVVADCQASTGYSTCFWSNLLNSEILFDTDDKLNALKSNFSIAYPEALKQNIIDKNLPLLTGSMPAYPKQVEKALKRKDRISVHHRVTEYLASYFDILFAINKIPHPGEKRLTAFTLKNCKKVPDNFEERVKSILSLAGSCDDNLHTELLTANNELKALL